MATQNLGRVGLVLKGEWDSATAYTALDVVSHDGNAWAAKQNSTNVEPTTGNSDFWQLFSNNADLVATVQGYKEDAASSATAAAASAADAAADAQYGEDAFNAIAHTFDPGADYTAGKYVWYNGELYRFSIAHPAGAWIGTDAARYTATDELPLIQQALGTKADAAEVEDVKDAITQASASVDETVEGWSQGSISASTGSTTSSNIRCRTGFIQFTSALFDEIAFTAKSGYKISIAEYSTNAQSGFVGMFQTMFEGTKVLKPNTSHYFRVIIGLTSDSNLTPSDIATDALTLAYKKPTDKTLSMSDIPADAKTTGERMSQLESDIHEDVSITQLLTWESGYINSSGNAASGLAYLRSNRYVATPCRLYMRSPNADYTVNIAEYNANGVFIKRYRWEPELRIACKQGYRYVFMIHDVNGADISDKASDSLFLNTFTISLVSVQSQIDAINEKIDAFGGKSIRILGIGNSYTWYVYRYLSKILTECGYTDIVVGQCYKGGITLAEQYANRTDTTFYQYYRKYTGGLTKVDTTGVSLEAALQLEDWDYIVIQQQSDESGQYASFVGTDFDINTFLAYISGFAPNAKIGLVSPWTHATGYDGERFLQYYNGDVALQDAAIKATIPRVAAEMSKCDFVVDLNILVDEARNNSYLGALGDEMLRPDKNHIDYGIPDYMCGVLYAMCIGADVKRLSWYPTLSDDSSITSATNGYLAWLARQAAINTYNAF